MYSGGLEVALVMKNGEQTLADLLMIKPKVSRSTVKTLLRHHSSLKSRQKMRFSRRLFTEETARNTRRSGVRVIFQASANGADP
eukprot:341078-Prorocentrum_minimum.AAC.1